jgi:hypothetical protein
VVAEHALRTASLHPAHHPVEHGRAVGPAVAQVAHEYGPTSLRVVALRRVTEVPEQGLQRMDLAMDVANDIERAVEQMPDWAV